MSKLIVICGLSFAGKSTLADAICEACGCVQVDVDVTMEDLYGPGASDDDLTPEGWDRIYATTDDRIVAHLREGDSVVDASRNFQRFERDAARATAQRSDAGFVLIHVDTPEAVARQRWTANRANPTRRDVADESFEQIVQVMAAPDDDETALVFHHTDDVHTWIAAHRANLT